MVGSDESWGVQLLLERLDLLLEQIVLQMKREGRRTGEYQACMGEDSAITAVKPSSLRGQTWVEGETIFRSFPRKLLPVCGAWGRAEDDSSVSTLWRADLCPERVDLLDRALGPLFDLGPPLLDLLALADDLGVLVTQRGLTGGEPGVRTTLDCKRTNQHVATMGTKKIGSKSSPSLQYLGLLEPDIFLAEVEKVPMQPSKMREYYF